MLSTPLVRSACDEAIANVDSIDNSSSAKGTGSTSRRMSISPTYSPTMQFSTMDSVDNIESFLEKMPQRIQEMIQDVAEGFRTMAIL